MGVQKPVSIASITLAYNSAGVLPKHLDSLLRQTRSLNEIIVVNNGSHDNTMGLLNSGYPGLTVIDLPDNKGAAGGYATGLAYAALKKKYDWVWLLDHDSIPENDALEMLLCAMAEVGQPDDVAVLACSPENSGIGVLYPGLLWRDRWILPPLDRMTQPVCFVDMVISSGSLIRREAVEQVGLPREDFFIDFVDFEYCLRLRRHGYRIAVVRDSRLEHEMGIPRRVRFLGVSRAWTEQPSWREYYLSRNYTYTVWNYYSDWKSKLFTVKWLLRHAAGIAAFGKNKLTSLRMMVTGFLDGRGGRLGIRFRPPATGGPGREGSAIESLWQKGTPSVGLKTRT
jgi:GT2 family glycosyltransferase